MNPPVIRFRMFEGYDIDGYHIKITRRDQLGYFSLKPLPEFEWVAQERFAAPGPPTFAISKDDAKEIMPQIIRDCVGLGIAPGLDSSNEIHALQQHIAYLQKTIDTLIAGRGTT